MRKLPTLSRFTLAAAALLALSGCVAYPVGGYYGSPGYYAAAPVVVGPPAYYGGGGRWHGHGRWR